MFCLCVDAALTRHNNPTKIYLALSLSLFRSVPFCLFSMFVSLSFSELFLNILLYIQLTILRIMLIFFELNLGASFFNYEYILFYRGIFTSICTCISFYTNTSFLSFL